MNPNQPLSWPTIATAIVMTAVAPFVAKYGFNLTPEQTAWMVAALVGAPTAIAHFLHSYMSKKTSPVVQTIAKVLIPLMLLLPLLHGCTTANGKLAPPTLTTSQLQALTKTVCTTLNADIVVLEGPTGKTLLAANPKATAELSAAGVAVASVCASGAAVDVTSLQTIVNTVLPALTDVVAAIPQIPDQPEILAGLTAAQLILIPVVNQLIDMAPASSAPSSAPASSAPPAALVPVPPQNRTFALIESPQAVGGATAALTIASLQAFWHISTSAPAAAAMVVLATLGAAYLDL